MQFYDALTRHHQEFIAEQKMFFVATAPLAEDARVNLSPKGYESFAVLGPGRVLFLDVGGSGAETIAHLRENGRVTFMFCSYGEHPLILRIYGTGRTHLFGTPEFEELRPQWPELNIPSRAIIDVEVTSVQTSCGWGVPHYEFVKTRPRLADAARKLGQEDWWQRRKDKGQRSIDGLPALSD